jgi:NAD-dependent DNA ligase/DNA polymerase/3'-5' exonuclease PolX
MDKTKKLKNKLIIESSSSSSSSNKSKSSSKSKTKKNSNNNKKKKLLIIESSSTTSSTPNKPEQTIKEKIELLNPETSNGITKTNLKISQDIRTMSNQSNSRLNEKFIELMEQLADIMLKQGEPFRARAYQKAQETIMAFPADILSPEQLKGKPGIGATIMEKLEEYVNTGTLKVLEREKNNPVNILAEVYGIGPKKAKELVDNGITSIQQLRENQDLLNDIQKVGLQYYEDILARIPRAEVEQYESIVAAEFKKIATQKSQFEIVGSYRRGAQSSGDIDMIITSDNSKVFVNLIDALIKKGIILEVLSRGPTKCLVIARIPGSPTARRVDFLYTNPEEFPFAILYFTGSKIFNTVMRHVALEKGFTMNEHGINKMDNKKKGEKVSHSFKTEKDIFDFLGLEFKAPQDRTDGRAIVFKAKKPQLIIEDETPEASPSSSSEEFVMIKKTVAAPKKLVIEEDSEELDTSIVAIANDFKKNGITVLEKLNENQLSALLREANKAYYNQTPFMTDNEYDIVKEYIESRYPSNQAIVEIGAQVERNKVSLPYPMGSMDKIKPDTNALANWMAKYKGPYVLSCKLDGVSGLYTTEGTEPKLYTRGDGLVGQDVSHLIPYLRLPKTRDIVIRGEFIIPKWTFDNKYKTKFANPRNMVAGIVNHKTINEAVNDLHFVAYEVIKPNKKPSEQIQLLSTLDVEVVLWRLEKNLSNEMLSEKLVEWRKNYAYEIDGVIVANDSLYEKKAGNPDHAFAFKMVLSDQIAEAKVVDVLWAPSKDGYLKPRVQIEPINLGGVRIEFATGFNGAFINDNKIGIGAVVELIRSGDVIPYIRKVTMPASNGKMPNVAYKWNDTHIDVLLEDIESDETVKEKLLTAFFRGIGVEGLSSGNIARIIQAGYDTIPEILKMDVEDFLEVEGFKEKMAVKLHDGIAEKIEAASLIKIMSASNMFGRGFSEIRLELIMNAYPTVLLSKESNSQKIAKISSIKGMAEKSAEAFVERIPDFIQFIKDAGLVKKLAQGITAKKTVDESHPLFGKSIVMTGFRDAELQNKIKEVGAKVGASVSKNTFILLVKDLEEDTGKAAEARRLGVKIMTPQQFNDKYF